jgi:hypothetical protein
MSVLYKILTALKDWVEEVDPGVPVVIRKKAIWLEGDKPPLVIIAPGPKGEKIRSQQFNKGVWWNYPVVMIDVRAANYQVQTDLEAYYDRREAIRNTLFQPILPGVVEAFDVALDPAEATELAAFLGTNYDVSGWSVIYTSAEERIS